MPKLWRAPIPMVRITAPQITAIQKLRCRGLAASSDEGTDMGRPNTLRILTAPARRRKYRIATRPAAHDQPRRERLNNVAMLITRFAAHANAPAMRPRERWRDFNDLAHD